MVNEMMEEVSDSTKHKTKTKSAEINIVIVAVSLVEERSRLNGSGFKRQTTTISTNMSKIQDLTCCRGNHNSQWLRGNKHLICESLTAG